MLMASLAVSDFSLGFFPLLPFGIPTLPSTEWTFSDAACQCDGYIALFLVFFFFHSNFSPDRGVHSDVFELSNQVTTDATSPGRKLR